MEIFVYQVYIVIWINKSNSITCGASIGTSNNKYSIILPLAFWLLWNQLMWYREKPPFSSNPFWNEKKYKHRFALGTWMEKGSVVIKKRKCGFTSQSLGDWRTWAEVQAGSRVRCSDYVIVPGIITVLGQSQCVGFQLLTQFPEYMRAWG